PFYLGIILMILGLVMSIFFIKDTRGHAKKEESLSSVFRLKNIFWDTTWKDRNLGSVTQAGLVNNLNDGMAWGLFPILLASKNFDLQEIGIIVAIYPAVWGMGQLITGTMADKFPKKQMLFYGMILQAIVLIVLVWAKTFWQFAGLMAMLGWGTAMVYPTFLATIAEYTHPVDRAESIGIFRLWRDLGYAVGAILTGIISDFISIEAAVLIVGIITFLSSGIIFFRMNTSRFDKR